MNIPKKIPMHIEMLVNQRAARENLYRPEYPEKFQNYVINFLCVSVIELETQALIWRN